MSALPHECNSLGCCTWHKDKAELTLGEFTIKHLTASGYECEKDHIHQRSRLCNLSYVCDYCDSDFEDEESAQGCCATWECLYCGYAQPSQHAAIWCCHTSCTYCGCEDWPDGLEYHDCDSGEDSDDNSMGTSAYAPWESRIKLTDKERKAARQPGKTWQKTWGFEPKHHDPVRAAGEFYVLEGLLAGALGDGSGPIPGTTADLTAVRILRDEARAKQESIVAEFAPLFQRYGNLAIGGELRHHTAIGGTVLPSTRSRAWAGWAAIKEVVGVQALADAAELFREFGGGTYGGKNWADCCDILYLYETHKISGHIFLDRVFNAQHNGGTFLNKVSWAMKNRMQYDVGKLQYAILPAHGAEPNPDYATLLSVCSAEVQELFATYWKVARIRGVRPYPKQPKVYVHNTPQSHHEQALSFANQAKYYDDNAAAYYAHGPTPDTNMYFTDYLSYKKQAEMYWYEAVKARLTGLIEGDQPQPSLVESHLAAWFEQYKQYNASRQQQKACGCWMCKPGSRTHSDDDGDMPDFDEDDNNDGTCSCYHCLKLVNDDF